MRKLKKDYVAPSGKDQTINITYMPSIATIWNIISTKILILKALIWTKFFQAGGSDWKWEMPNNSVIIIFEQGEQNIILWLYTGDQSDLLKPNAQ